MAVNLHDMPVDIINIICEWTSLTDFVNVTRVNKALHELKFKGPIRIILEEKYRYSKEAKMAFAGLDRGLEQDQIELVLWKAMSRLYDRMQGVIRASPCSIAVLSNATEFIYQEGVLLYLINADIRILNVHRSAKVEQVVNLHNILHRIISDQHQHAKTKLLYYSSGILALQAKLNRGTWLVVLDVTREHLVKFVMELEQTKKLFVRHNRHHLFFGFNSDFYEYHWAIRYVDLEKGSVTEPTVLYNFEGTEFGDDVCFGIFDNALYAVSNYLDGLDMNGQSYYKWVCLLPNSNLRTVTAKRIWRRNHDVEGPMVWRKISLQVDEITGRPMVLECRDERPGSEQIGCRTYYGELLPRVHEFNDVSPKDSFPLLGPTKEDLAEYRKSMLVHSEYRSDLCKRRDFLQAYTVCTSYNLSAGAFIDLVKDPISNSQSDKIIRLRINSHKCTQHDKVHTAVQLWPSNHDQALMNPFGTSRENKIIRAEADERSLIYSVTSGSHHQAIILVSFDPLIRFPCMRGKTATVSSSEKQERSAHTEPAKHLSIGQGNWFGLGR